MGWGLIENIKGATGATGLTGVILPFAGAAGSVPAWAVLCDGSSYLRAGAMAALFAVIGTTYGSVDGTHFNVPDCRGKVLAAYKSGDAYFGTLGASVGFPDVTLSAAQSGLPAHGHAVAISISATALGSSYLNPGNSAAKYADLPNVAEVSTAAPAASSHTNVQPSLVVNAIIGI
jgi:microcystin-dependent protein